MLLRRLTKPSKAWAFVVLLGAAGCKQEGQGTTPAIAVPTDSTAIAALEPVPLGIKEGLWVNEQWLDSLRATGSMLESQDVANGPMSLFILTGTAMSGRSYDLFYNGKLFRNRDTLFFTGTNQSQDPI